MKNIGKVILFLSAGIVLIGCGKKPESVLKIVFESAKSGNYDQLRNICDPLGENDGDTRAICEMTAESAVESEFNPYFETGEIVGSPRINGDTAKVDFTFGPDGKREETMVMIRREGKWYLFRF